jgi:hypothetical protein
MYEGADDAVDDATGLDDGGGIAGVMEVEAAPDERGGDAQHGGGSGHDRASSEALHGIDKRLVCARREPWQGGDKHPEGRHPVSARGDHRGDVQGP